MLKEISLYGVYFPPILVYLIVSAPIWAVLRWLLQKAGVYRWVWHAPLFNTALYILVLAAVLRALR